MLGTNCNFNELVLDTTLSERHQKIEEEVFNVKASHYRLFPQLSEHKPLCHSIAVLHNPMSLMKRRIGDRYHEGSIEVGNIAIMPANVTHSTYWDEEAAFTLLLLKPEFIASIAYEDIDPDGVELLPNFIQHDPVISGIAQGLRLQLESGKPISQIYFDQLAFTVAVHILEFYCLKRYKLPETNHAFSTAELQQVLDYFDSHIDKQIGLLEISNLLGMSQNHFGQLFKKSIGTPPAQYFMNRRLKIATYLLKATNLNIGVIAVQTGFSSQSQFCNTFKQHLGITPRQYRTML